MPKIISAKTKFAGRMFTIRDVRVRHDNGREFTYEVNEKPGMAGAMVVALDGRKRVVLISEYFVGIDETQLCLPKGKVDAGETAKTAARRELEEETGYRAGKIRLMATLTLSPGYTNQRTSIFLATNLTRPKTPLCGDEMQAPAVVLMPLSKAIEWTKDGTITEARAIAALFLARDFLRKKR